MSTSSVHSGTSSKSASCHTIVIAPPIIPSSYNAKNAGRKKTNPVWNFFVDLKTKGLSGVRCRYCEWITNDRSPTTLKFHLKRKHDTGLGGIWNIVEERIGINQPQGRSRTAAVNSRNGDNSISLSAMDNEAKTETDREQQCYPETGARVVVDAKPSSSQQQILDQFLQNATKSAKLNGALSGAAAPSTSAYAPPSNSISFEQDNVFETKGLVDDNLLLAKSGKSLSPKAEFDGETETGEIKERQYVLSDGSNIAELLHVANDMDLAFTYNSRRTGEFCFESNAQDMRGRLVVFADLGTKVAVRERFNGNDLSYEEWKKSDWKQFLWAVRGKCMNVLRGL